MEELTRENNPNFYKLWDLKSNRTWFHYRIYAKTTKDLEMSVWNGKYPAEYNMDKHICKSGTEVRIWMVSRFGDVGITDNLKNPKGYDARGLDADIDLTDFKFVEIC